MSEYVSGLENTIRLDGLLSSQATIAQTSCIGTQTWQLLVIITSLTEHLGKWDTESVSYDWV